MDRTFSNERIERFGERLKLAMKGMTKSELARRSGISEGAIRKYLIGESYPAINNAAKVADACNVPLPWLLLGDDVSSDCATQNQHNSTIKAEDRASSTLISLLSMVSERDRNALAVAASEIGIKGILSKLQQPDAQHGQPEREYTREEQEAMLRALPISERVKNTASLALALGDDAHKEILEILEDVKRRYPPEGSAAFTPDSSLKQKAG
ncbi:helix-turn-helix transcriptional regulator [Salmonella enterica]|nr:helix-turn-helix transcriptional regulator [Salmonella enterica]EFR3984499.1 helix-turn-helix transcriptional regulator [Salmonella enterica]EID4166471.1 helix-turn-helix transcriptional regulator [Salmonella enterica]EIE0427934.1 helix-turn-helix transcriptional regulator [Salmonella enterica]EKH3230466.1 helix-turn-helix transcriptional regulator [Salmonella enterica]